MQTVNNECFEKANGGSVERYGNGLVCPAIINRVNLNSGFPGNHSESN